MFQFVITLTTSVLHVLTSVVLVQSNKVTYGTVCVPVSMNELLSLLLAASVRVCLLYAWDLGRD